MKLVFVTQEVDADHPVLAQTVDLVGALAERVDELAILARRIESPLPANVEGRTFDATSRSRRVIDFERGLAGSLARADAVIVHMVPEFAALAFPLSRLQRVPVLIWYTHWNASRTLRLATRLVDVALSVDARSFPIASPKVRAIGHAIDVERFDGPPVSLHDGPLRILAFGRTARWKGLTTLLDAVASLGGVELAICGPSLTPDEHAHRAELESRIRTDPRLAGRARLREPVPRHEVQAMLAWSDVVASPNEPRSGATQDKAVFEAAACRRPVVSTNDAFASLLGDLPLPLLAPPQRPEALAATLATIRDADLATRVAVGETLRGRVVENHSVAPWADAVCRVVREVRSARGTAGPRRSG
jgi:glycosyltransferase involved in cell wall biosynthesis